MTEPAITPDLIDALVVLEPAPSGFVDPVYAGDPFGGGANGMTGIARDIEGNAVGGVLAGRSVERLLGLQVDEPRDLEVDCANLFRRAADAFE